ncbi:unnamed protein product (macronuclear) [Paramecium tetraurelia]|uniref:Uncharacterized protein n=1 Tax=Paramecium tetraurelia TaxID=5888 RepID=A0CVW0_PARTE|nr:uncharacterized protein GSPATT00001129001 [Paramecium tetraurelia]CAK74927.1 unnamed protein product [Paramecium tetraurelia]|eukprot:XP_001442324.1 hypothetical protein (macronuclear) [Paramecium tetraurelia strain d4-2]
MNWKQVYAFSEHRTKRILSGNAKFKEHKSNIHSPRSKTFFNIQDSQHSHKDTMIGLQRISKEIVESLTKALTPNFKVRQNSPKPIPQEQEQKQILKSNKEPEIIRQPLEQMENVKQNKEIENVEYINFTKLARKISQQPIKEIKIQKNEQKITRQRSQDFHSKQEEWLRKKNEKVFKQRIEQQCQQQRKENRLSFLEKSQTDRFQ